MKEKFNWSVIEMPGLIDASQLYEEPPWERGRFTYKKPGQVIIDKIEDQVSGSLARYNHPKFKEAHYEIMKFLEEYIGEKLYPTYYYDRFYFKNQKLEKHTDRGACEVSISINISNNLDYDWPLMFENQMGVLYRVLRNRGMEFFILVLISLIGEIL